MFYFNRASFRLFASWLVTGGVVLFISLSYAQSPGEPPFTSFFQTGPDQQLQFDHLTGDDGLASERIETITQDQQGFIWFGTWNGLYRYDGHTLKLYEHDPADPHSLAGNQVSVLHVDRAGKLWVGLTEAGVDRFDPVTEQFSHYAADLANPAEPFNMHINAITEDNEGEIWFATYGQGLYQLDPATGQMRGFRPNPADPDSLASDNVLSLLFDRAGQLWVGTDRGLDRLDPATGRFTHYLNDPADPQNLLTHLILSMAEDGSGNVWLAVYDLGLHRFNPRTGALTRYANDPANPESVSDNNIWKVYVDRAGTLWVGTNAGGLNRYAPDTDRFYSYQHDPFVPTSLLQGAVREIFADRAGSLWLAVDGGGVAVWHPTKTAFGHYAARPTPESRPGSLNTNSVKAIYQDRSGLIWLGTATGGLNRLDPATGQFTYYRHKPDDPDSLTGDSLYAIYEDRAGALWVGSFTGLNRFDRATGQVTRYQYDPADPHSLSASWVHAITEDRQGTLWVATRDGLNRFDRASGQFTAYQHDPGNPASLSNNEVLSLYPAQDGRLWVGTGAGGLNAFDPTTGRFTPYRHEPDNPNSLSSDFISSIYQDDSGLVWLATRNGLNRLEPATGRITRYGRPDGLPADMVIGILEDAQGYLWLSTFGGLSRFDPRSETFKNFDNADGLNNLQYDFHAYYRARDGRLWFGGKNGLDIVDPSRLVENPHAPSVVLTEVEINNRPVPIGGDSGLPQSITTAEALTLDYEDRVVTFEFAALNFVNPGENRYKHKLEGFDRDWVETTADRPFATYTNLAPGDYVFRVIAANNDGVWNEAGASIRLTMTPAWWQTWWFYGLSAAGVLAIFGFVYQAKANQVRTEKAAAAAVRESEEKYRVLFESFPLGITVSDRAGQILEANATAEKLLGVPKLEHEQRDLNGPEWRIIRLDGTLMPPEEYASVRALTENRLVDNIEMGVVKDDDIVTWLTVTAAPVPLEDYGVVVAYGDTTPLKEVKDALRQKEMEYRTVADFTYDWETWENPDGSYRYVSPACERVSGYTPVEFMQNPGLFRNIILPEDRPQWDTHHHHMNNPLLKDRLEFRIRRKDGQIRCIEHACRTITDSAGNFLGFRSSNRNVTERKQAEAQLRFQATLLDAVDQAVIATDPVGTITYFNQAAEELYGWPAAEAVGRNIASVTAPLMSEAEVREIMNRLLAGQPWHGEFRVRGRDGTTFPALVYNSPILDESGQVVGIIGISTDISEQKQREEEHIRQERLAAVGELAAGISHDFNNLLMTMMGNASLLQNRPDTPDKIKPRLGKIVQQGERAARLVRQILDFSRQTEQERQALGLRVYLKETLRFIERTIPETIHIQFNYDQDDYIINADPTQLQQVITNLAVNARDAMPRGGTLYFNLDRFTLAAGEAAPCPELAAGEWIRLAVTDTGSGIAPEHLPHIFEPFFTTKAVGQGTGLGLAQIYGIMIQHEGHITVDSQVGQGTTFTLYFPATFAQPVSGPLVAPSVPMGQGQTVLLVEDDQAVREVVQAMLEALDYRVLTAKDGSEGLLIYRNQASQIAVVLTDGLMPTMDGFEMASTLRTEAADLKIILMSGYSEPSQQLPQNFVAQLRKPLELHPLAEALHQALNGMS